MAAHFSAAGVQLTARALSTHTGALQAGQLHEGSPQPRAGWGGARMSSVGTVQPLAGTRLDSQKLNVHSVPLPYAFRTLSFPKLSVHAVAPRL